MPNHFIYIPDPNCHMCDGTGEVPETGMGLRNGFSCSCRKRTRVVLYTTYKKKLDEIRRLKAELGA